MWSMRRPVIRWTRCTECWVSALAATVRGVPEVPRVVHGKTPSSQNTSYQFTRDSREIYGALRTHAELAMGIRCSRKRVARLMRKAGLVEVRR